MGYILCVICKNYIYCKMHKKYVRTTYDVRIYFYLLIEESWINILIYSISYSGNLYENRNIKKTIIFDKINILYDISLILFLSFLLFLHA